MARPFRIGVTSDFLDAQGKLAFPDIGLDTLDGVAGIEWEFMPGQSDVVTAEQAATYDGIVVLRPAVTAATVSGPDRRLGVIARFGVGYDKVDVPALTANGVLLAIATDGVRRPVAQAVLTFILMLAGRVMDKDRITRAGQWGRAGEFMGMGVTGRTLGLVGVGNIGGEIVGLVKPFGMRVLAHDPYCRPEVAAKLGVTLVDLDTLVREADFVSVNCPLNDQTRGMIGARQFAQMKPTAYLINTARGPIVAESDLYQALKERRIAGAGLDVFEEEPTPATNPILALDNVIVTPHALCWTDECFRGNGASAFRACIALARGEVPNHIVNRDALKHPSMQTRVGAAV